MSQSSARDRRCMIVAPRNRKLRMEIGTAVDPITEALPLRLLMVDLPSGPRARRFFATAFPIAPGRPTFSFHLAMLASR